MKVTKLIVFSLMLTGIGLSYAGDVKLTKDQYNTKYYGSPATTLDARYAQYVADWNRLHPVESGVLPFLPASPTPSPMASPILGAASAPAGPLSADVMDSLFGDGYIPAPAPMLPALAPQYPYGDLEFGEDELLQPQRQQQAIRAQKEYQDQYELQEEEANPFTQNRPGFFEDDVAAEPVAPRAATEFGERTTGLNFGVPAGRYSETARAPRTAMDLFGDDNVDDEKAIGLLHSGDRREAQAALRSSSSESGAADSAFGIDFYTEDKALDYLDMDFDEYAASITGSVEAGAAKESEEDMFGVVRSPAVTHPAVASFDEAGFSLGAPGSGYVAAAEVEGEDLLGLGAPVGSVVPPVVVASGTRNLFDDSEYESTDGADLGFVLPSSAATSDRAAGAPFDVSALFAVKDVLPAVSTSGLPAYPVDLSADMGGSAEEDPFAELLTEPVVVPTLSPDDAQNLPKLEEYLIKQKAFDYARVIDTSLADKLSAAGSSDSSPSVASRVESRSVSPLSAGSLDSTDVDGGEPSKEALAGGSRLVPAVKTISESDIDFGNVVSVERALVDVVGLRYNDVVNENFTDKVETLRDYIKPQEIDL